MVKIISTDEDPSLRIESFTIINLRGISTKLNWYCIHHANVLGTDILYYDIYDEALYVYDIYGKCSSNIELVFNKYWMRLSGISRIIEAEVGVICRSRRLRQITLTEASIILDIPRKPNSIIILLFTWTVLSFTWTILLFTWADTKIMI